MKKLSDLKIKIFLDCSGVEDFKNFSHLPFVRGFTTNPSLLRKGGVADYAGFIKEILPLTHGRPVSLEVISDDFAEMETQAINLSSLAENICVKIPIMNTQGSSSVPLIRGLIRKRLKLNVTAIMTIGQIEELVKVLVKDLPTILSIFAGRIADTGVDPVLTVKKACRILKKFDNTELLWASPRELLNIFQAEEAGCHIITVLPEILKKIDLIGYDLHAFSLDTVKMFYNDAKSSGFKI